MSEEISHMQEMSYTPLPDHIVEKRHLNLKKLFVFFFLIAIVVALILGGWYMYYFYTTPLIQTNANQDNGLTVIPSKNPTATPSAELIFDGSIPADWARKNSLSCSATFRIPPAEEPYMMPRDPNTPPTSVDDEGKYWIYEEFDTKLFMLTHMVRAIFKNPELPASGYVSSAVEVYCADNDERFTTESFFVQIQNDLLENYSVVKINTVGGAELWEREVRSATFEGGTFDANDIYYIFATNSHVYMVRAFGESSNANVQAVRDQILQGVQFE